MGKNNSSKSAKMSILNALSSFRSSDQPKEATVNQTLRNTNATTSRIEHVAVETLFEDALKRAFDIGHLAWDRPTYVNEAGEILPVTESDGAWLFLPPWHPMARRSWGRVLAMLEAGRYQLNVKASNFDENFYVIETVPGLRTYSGYPERLEVQWEMGPDGWPVAAGNFVSLRSWGGSKPVAVSSVADVRHWDASFERERIWTERQIIGATAMNEGVALTELHVDVQAVMSKVKPRDGRYYVPRPIQNNYPWPVHVHAMALGQQYLRSQGFTHRIGAIVAGATDRREASSPGSRERAMRQLMLMARWYDFERQAIAGRPVADTATESMGSI